MDTLVWQAFASVIVPGQDSFSYNENYDPPPPKKKNVTF